MNAATVVRVGQSQIIVGVKDCKGCGVEFSTGWTEAKLPIVIAGRRHLISIPICEDCAPHIPLFDPPQADRSPVSGFDHPVEVGHL